MLKGRGRDPRTGVPGTPTLGVRSQPMRVPLAKPEPDYEVVEFPSEQYVNAKLQPPPPPPPRPPTGHPMDAGASCGLCGGGGARVRCAECGRRALCASCDDMYHRHPKRRHHQRQALPPSLLRDERPPLPPKGTPPVPPPRRHKIGGERCTPSPLLNTLDQRRAATNIGLSSPINQSSTLPHNNHFAAQRQVLSQQPTTHIGHHVGSMPYLPGAVQRTSPALLPHQEQANAMGQFSPWGRPRTSLPGYNVPSQNIIQNPQLELTENHENMQIPNWGRPLRRGTSVMDLGGPPCGGCAHCAPNPWRYGSCANLDHSWTGQGQWAQSCCPHPSSHGPGMHLHSQIAPPQTPQPYRRADSRAMSRAGSRGGSRAPSPAQSMRSRTSRRTKHRTPSPPLPSSDADSESEPESDGPQEIEKDNSDLGPAPLPPNASWQCEHCTFVNEPGVRVCTVCCRTPISVPKVVAAINNNMAELTVTDNNKIQQRQSLPRQDVQRNRDDNRGNNIKKDRVSTGSGRSPPKEGKPVIKTIIRLETPTKEQSFQTSRHDKGVGSSPPKEYRLLNSDKPSQMISTSSSATTTPPQQITKHSVSVGPSPPRLSPGYNSRQSKEREISVQKKSVGESPPPQTIETRPESRSSRTNVSNTGTSPPPQSISTQTYDAPNNWDRPGSRSRRRFRDENRRERSHSRHSLSSDTRESERSTRTSGGRWEWKEPRDSSPGGADWSENERRRTSRLTRRASHLDLRRNRPSRRSSVYGSEAPSPEPLSNNRAISLEALAGANSRRDAERGLELARLMSEAERLGFSAAEVHAALAQNPVAPLAWLRERWPSLCAGVRAAAARLASGINVTELEARAALAKHRGAMWPAVTECVERHRRQAGDIRYGEEGKLRGHVWGSPMGADDDAAPPPISRSHRMRAEDSSDEFEVSTYLPQDDDWMYLPLDNNNPAFEKQQSQHFGVKIEKNHSTTNDKLKMLINNVKGSPNDENMLLKTLLLDRQNMNFSENQPEKGENIIEFIQSEKDFIEAYNALTRLSPLPNIEVQSNVKSHNISETNTSILSIQHQGSKNEDNFKYTDVDEQTNKFKANMNSHKTDVKDNVNTKQKKISTEKNNKSNTDRSSHQKSNQNDEASVIEINETKSSNLSEMVDNTQKIIQQMKNEIKNDINDSNPSTLSSKTSSSNSEISMESSYDESNHDTDELTSDENEISTDDNIEIGEMNNTHKNQEISTSSEDNEQFEEAMDYLETPLNVNEFEETNFKLLDSLARSLQTDHIIRADNISNPGYLNITSKEDNNTSLEIVSKNHTIPEVILDTNVYISGSLKDPGESIVNVKSQSSNPEKHSLPILLTLSNTNSSFEVKDGIANKSNSVVVKSNSYDIKIEKFNKNKFSVANSFEEIYEQLSGDGETTMKNEKLIIQAIEPRTRPSPYVKQIMNITCYKADTPIKGIFTEYKFPVSNAITEYHYEALDMPSPIIKTDTIENVVTEVIDETQNIKNEKDSNTTNESMPQTDTIIESIIIDNSNHITNNNSNNLEMYPVIHNDLKTGQDQIQESTEKSITIVDTKKVGQDKTRLQANKLSNIPVLIKTKVTKQKPDKNNKVIISKVPVRRASIKQYPAPSPPKSHFGDVQNGIVKQLQTRLFHTKPSDTNNDMEASTSTANSKHEAPHPISQSETTVNKEKQHFFRETCRTEDEWTDSESDREINSPHVQKEKSPTPEYKSPAPLTMRRISGQLVDLAKIRLPEGSPERQARMLLAEGATETWDQAQLAVDLIARGTEAPVALLAALECIDLTTALAYINQYCELCAANFPEHEMVSLLGCSHRCCRECAHHYFTVQITERSIVDCVCPYCKDPELEDLDEDAWVEYFAHLDILLKTLLEVDVHELFQRKLRDRTLARDPNFRWCVECSSGFFVHPKHKKFRCPECKSVTCATCRKPWSTNHDGLSCEQYAAWLDDNEPERSIAAVNQHLKENGLECPRCRFKYSLSRGGCMHFTCTQCKYEFCYGCGKPFTMGARCGLSEYCAKLGLHSHHPRNCLFYLRDKEPHELQTLLQMNNVTYETEAPQGSGARCPIQLQRETPTGLIDTTCGSEITPNYAGLCKLHYVEYLAGLARTLDPIPIMEVSELVAELRRRALPLPERGPWDTDPIYAGMCAEIVKEKIPLD